MKNQINMTLRGMVSLMAVVAISGAYAQGGYGDGTRIMQRATPTPVASAAAKAAATSAQDKHFLNEAAHGGLMEVADGKMAAEHATNAEVKNFGHRMVTDHGKANDKLVAIATSHGFSVPKSAEPSKWSGDKDYMARMVQDHEKDLAEFKTEASKGTDPQLKAFAAETSHVIAEHLHLAKQIEAKLK